MVGLGAQKLGGPGVSEAQALRLLDVCRELGVRLIDTAVGYGECEARLGRWLGPRRRDFLLSTKLGYGVPGVPDWTGRCIRQGVDLALRKLRTDVLDIAHLHSCPSGVLERGEVGQALESMVKAGKVRVAAYSGDAHALYVAQRSGHFSSVQATLSVCDRHNAPTLALAAQKGMGVIIKRALANAPWRAFGPATAEQAEYRRRWEEMSVDLEGLAPAEVFLRFAGFQPDVSCVLVGTTDPAHLQAAVQAVHKGPLPSTVARAIDAAWQSKGADYSPLT